MAQPRVFLSHSSKDAAFTQRLETDLRAAGAAVYRVAADQGGNFQKRIDEALLACEWVVLVLTADALASPWVEQEIYAAIRLKNQRRVREILPIQASPVDYTAIPPLWGVYNVFDATRDYTAARDALLRTLGLTYVAAATAPAASPNPLPPSLGGKGLYGEGAAAAARHASPVAPPVVPSAGPAIPRERFPDWLAQRGYEARKVGGIEVIVPPVVTIPAGEFLMGSDPKRDKGAFDDEQPQRKVSLPTFQLAKFPLTVAEYACFVRSGHAEPPRWEYQGKVVDWQTQLRRLDHPAVVISWHDVVAYAAWVAKQTGQPWRLPSEAEWEKGARGTDGRIYPWGDSFDKARCNTSEGGKGTTTPVGSYPSGASPYGAQDMTGNVWEWTSSLFKPYPYNSTDGRENVKSTENRVLRGGSWYDHSRVARAACRDRNHPGNVYGNDGARLACAVPNS